MADTKLKVGNKIVIVETVNDKIFPQFIEKRGSIVKVDVEGSTYPYEVDVDGVDVWCKRVRAVGAAKDIAPPKFILQYELDTDPFEFFATEKDARKRIAELAERTDLKRDSIRLIEIKKIRTVKLGVKISISK